jgi:cobalt-zinc-cadmium efflux system protein
VLLEGVPEGTELAQVELALRGCEGVASVHDLHVWSIASDRISLSVHAVLAPSAQPGDTMLRRIRGMLAERFGIHHSTVQLETAPCEQQRAEHGFGPGQPS